MLNSQPSMVIQHSLQFGQHQLILTNERVIYWPQQQTLILSDAHFGKTTHFRKHGIAVPEKIAQQDFARLSHLINIFNAQHLLIVGDLFHSTVSGSDKAFKLWREKIGHMCITLVLGNHDRWSSQQYKALSIDTIEEQLQLEGIVFIHEQKSFETEQYSISGHVHPGIKLSGFGGIQHRLPCFVIQNKRHIVLPAFSLFTGLNSQIINKQSAVFAFNEQGFYIK